MHNKYNKLIDKFDRYNIINQGVVYADHTINTGIQPQGLCTDKDRLVRPVLDNTPHISDSPSSIASDVSRTHKSKNIKNTILASCFSMIFIGQILVFGIAYKTYTLAYPELSKNGGYKSGMCLGGSNITNFRTNVPAIYNTTLLYKPATGYVDSYYCPTGVNNTLDSICLPVVIKYPWHSISDADEMQLGDVLSWYESIRTTKNFKCYYNSNFNAVKGYYAYTWVPDVSVWLYVFWIILCIMTFTAVFIIIYIFCKEYSFYCN